MVLIKDSHNNRYFVMSVGAAGGVVLNKGCSYFNDGMVHALFGVLCLYQGWADMETCNTHTSHVFQTKQVVVLTHGTAH